jgi:hypothetical protein
VKELEKKVAEISQSESVRLRAAQQENQRLREALSTTKSRILSLASALTETATKIGDCLDTHDDDLNSFSQAGDNNDDCSNEDAEDAEDAEESATRSHSEVSQEVIEHAHPVNQVVGSNFATATIVRESVLNRTLSPLSPGTRNFDENFGLDLANYTRAVPHAPISSSWQLTNLTDGHGSIETQYPEWPPALADTAIPDTFSEHSSSRSGLYLAQPSPGAMHSLTMDNYPPGLATFPSVFAAHLSVCEFFVRQSEAYKDRANPGGQEA